MNGRGFDTVGTRLPGQQQWCDDVRRANTTGGAAGPLSEARMTWLRTADGRHVLARVDEPVSGSARGALVVVPSFGRESTVPFRRLRALAVRAADAGYVTLSPSLGGDGESQGVASGADLLATWSAELDAAIEAAAEAVPGRPVNVVGWRLGGALAYAQVAASPPNPLVSGEVLMWEPVSGASFIRQHQNLRRFASPVAPVSEGVELCGVHLSPEQARSLGALKVPRSLPPGVPASIVRESDPRAVLQLTLGSPHFVKVHAADVDGLVARLRGGETAPFEPVPDVRSATWVEPGVGEITETVVLVGTDRLPGVITGSPGVAPTCAVLFTAIGAELRTGPGATWTRAARECAPDGVVSLRMDRRHLGEDTDVTDPHEPYPYTEQSVRDVVAAAHHLRASIGTPVLGVGACSGGWSLLRGTADGVFTAVLAINPIHWDPDPANYDDDFYQRTYQAEGAFAETISAAAGPDAEGGTSRPGWRMRIDPALHRLARRFPRLRGLLRGDRRTDRVPALLRLVPAETDAVLAMGPGEAAVFRAKGGSGHMAVARNAAHTRLVVDPCIDHSLFAAAGRDMIRRLLRDEIVERASSP